MPTSNTNRDVQMSDAAVMKILNHIQNLMDVASCMKFIKVFTTAYVVKELALRKPIRVGMKNAAQWTNISTIRHMYTHKNAAI